MKIYNVVIDNFCVRRRLRHFSTLIREAFKNKNDETYGIFHMSVDPPPPPPLPTYGKFFRDFLLSIKDF